MSVLVINSGSSSIKYQVVDPETGESQAKGLVEQIGLPSGHIEHTGNGETREFNGEVPSHAFGLQKVLEFFKETGPSLTDGSIVAVGHRVVQGGKYFDGPALATDEVIKRIEQLQPLGPLHNPPALEGLRVAKELLPEVPHVVVFDTAFFQSLPEEAARYALKRDVADKYEIRRYGAHGTSHKFVSSEVAKMLGRDDAKQIVLHIGNGASASAVDSGKAVETSMGLTPLEGLVMGGRTGDIDPAAVFHLIRQAGMDVEELDNLFNRQSGMQGLCGSSDLRHVHEMAENGDKNAQEAVDIYVHRIVKYTGSYTAVLGGLDAITFTAGVGENDNIVRARVLDRLAPFGVRYDAEKNDTRSKEPREISTEDSSVRVFIVPTNEELEIARQATDLVNSEK
ncbi:acetate/propionate family kinase [Actinobaculum massiliense]|uniref:acetate/propionate family kinase n=1 Tax=Actinobaculum massiliense TaxID=202789 RepID=UPI0025513233|nr:acetate kinase [Actinobaculum massiliense]MDK8319188.1 acetate kinase [Actinobaculum massiliense]